MAGHMALWSGWSWKNVLEWIGYFQMWSGWKFQLIENWEMVLTLGQVEPTSQTNAPGWIASSNLGWICIEILNQSNYELRQPTRSLTPQPSLAHPKLYRFSWILYTFTHVCIIIFMPAHVKSGYLNLFWFFFRLGWGPNFTHPHLLWIWISTPLSGYENH